MLVAHAKCSVLVVEDDSDLRLLYRMALMAAGYAVVAVEDGVGALSHIESAIPKAVILDMELPRLGGRDVHRELAARAETRDIPIVVVSGTDIRDLDPADFACILRKPIDVDEVVEAVDRCCGRGSGGCPSADGPAGDGL